MQIKDYQQQTLDALQRWCYELIQQRTSSLAWDELRQNKLVPYIMDRGKKHAPPYIARTAANKLPIPHVCLKVPTGGGKTFLGVQALQHLTQSTGFVLWVVPTKSIYEQTLTAFRTREHPYRQVLENLSNHRLKILEKNDYFTRSDVENNFCLMILTLSSANRKKSKEFLKMFRDGARYASFFPEIDDVIKNKQLMQQHPDLEKNKAQTWVRQSLFNVFKLLRPTVVLDEAHKAYGKNDDKSLEFVKSVNRLNPCFVLELSATPKTGMSNILVNVSGLELKAEEMIKLPIEIRSFKNSSWQHTLAETQNKLKALEQQAQRVYHKERAYIRPIAVVRVEQTGKKQLGTARIHAQDAKKYLIANLGVPPNQIAIQSSEQKELAGVDLKSNDCPIRWIITKDALKEGWDCSFAYVLTLLDNTKALTAITQMAGRVMRQPYAQYFKNSEALNRCYIYCFNNKVRAVVEQVKKGLEAEGLSGLSQFVQAEEGLDAATKTIHISRRSKYKKQGIFLPQVLHKQQGASIALGSKKNKNSKALWGPIDYDRHILGQLDWQKLSPGPCIDLTKAEVAREIKVIYNLQGHISSQQHELQLSEPLSRDYFIRRLLDVVPNPWQAARLVDQFIQNYRQEMIEQQLMQNKTYLSENLKQHIKACVDVQAERVFRQKVAAGDIRFYLEADKDLNYEVEQNLTMTLPRHSRRLERDLGEPIQYSLFDMVYEESFDTEFEKQVAVHLDQGFEHLDKSIKNNTAIYLKQSEALHWWHRIAARQDYALQGWRRHRVWPDFLAYRGDQNRLMIVELKGEHLKGNPDLNKE